jgi:hypothetical protein
MHEKRPRLLPLVAAGVLLAAGAMTVVGATLGLEQGLEPQPDRPVRTPDAAVDGTTTRSGSGTSDRDEGFALWDVDHRGAPLRWDACSPVTFVLNADGAPPGAEQDVRAALALIADASGLELTLLGTTTETPSSRRPLVEPAGASWRWRPVLIAWSTPGSVDLPLGVSDRGVAFPVAVRDGAREALVTGQLVMNASRVDLVPGFGDRSDAVGATLVHELLHILGLDHVDDPAQLMSTEPGAGPVVLGDGDRAGLHVIGAAGGCTASPPPSSGRGLVASR